MTLGDRIVIMKDGYIHQIGTPQDVFNHPANLFVAGFIGTPQMNFFDAVLKREDSAYYVEAGGYRVQVSEEKAAHLREKNVESQDIILGVRPEHLEISGNGVPASVDVSEMMGSSIHLHVTAEDRDIIIVVPTLGIEKSYDLGDRISFSFGGNVVHLFSREDEHNLEY